MRAQTAVQWRPLVDVMYKATIIHLETTEAKSRLHKRNKTCKTSLKSSLETDSLLLIYCIEAVSYTHLTLPTNREV